MIDSGLILARRFLLLVLCRLYLFISRAKFQRFQTVADFLLSLYALYCMYNTIQYDENELKIRASRLFSTDLSFYYYLLWLFLKTHKNKIGNDVIRPQGT